MAIALFDMDGTLCDFVGAMQRDLKKLRGRSEAELDPFEHGQDPRFAYLKHRMNLIKSSEEWWANLPKLQLGFDILEEARRIGYSCEILTQSPRDNPKALAGKLRWIRKHLPEEMEDFTMTRNKARHYGRVLVDDYPRHIESWLQHRRKGLVIMPENKYNKRFSHPQVIGYNGENFDQVQEGLERAFEKKETRV